MNRIYSFGFFSSVMFERVLWMVYLKSIGWTVLEISFAQAILTLSQVFFEIPSGYISDKFSRKASLIMGQLCIILYVTSYFFAMYHHIFIIGFIMYGLGLSLISGSDESLIYEKSKNEYAKVNGRYNSIVMIALLVSISLGGILSGMSWNILFVLTIIFQIISVIILFGVKEKKKKKRKKVKLVKEVR